jgi:hypothetical protein
MFNIKNHYYLQDPQEQMSFLELILEKDTLKLWECVGGGEGSYRINKDHFCWKKNHYFSKIFFHFEIFV